MEGLRMTKQLEDVKNQFRELLRKQNELQEVEVEKLLKDFIGLILDDRIPLEIKKDSLVSSFKSSILGIFR